MNAEINAAAKAPAAVLSRPAVVAALAILTTFLWGTASPGVKIGMRLFGIIDGSVGDKMLFAGLRFFFSGVVILIFFSLKDHRFIRPDRKNLPLVLLTGVTQTTLQYAFYYVGLSNSDGSRASLINGTYTIFAILMAVYIFRTEKMTFRKVVGCVLGFAGIVILSLEGGSFGFTVRGDLMMLIATIVTALSANISKIATSHENAVAVSGYQFVYGGALLITLGLVSGGRVRQFDWRCAMILGYLILLSAVAYTIWTVLLAYNPVATVTVYFCFVPVFAGILSGIFLHENILRVDYFVTLLLIVLSIAIVNGGAAVKKQAQ